VNIHDNISHPIDADIRHQEYMNFVETGIHDQTDLKGRDIVIEDDVWIGFNATILRGVRIGKGAIIGACSLVTKDVEPWTINVGNPLQCIKKMNPIEVNHDTKN
jgi:acetyltransferase-like isoleucine patch superfamily enzyme